MIYLFFVHSDIHYFHCIFVVLTYACNDCEADAFDMAKIKGYLLLLRIASPEEVALARVRAENMSTKKNVVHIFPCKKMDQLATLC